MQGIPDSISDGIRKGDFEVNDREKKIISRFHGKSVMVLDTPDTLVAVGDNTENSERAREVYSIYERDVKTKYDEIKNYMEETKSFISRIERVTKTPISEISTITEDNFALENYQAYKKIVEKTAPKDMEEIIENIELADDLTNQMASSYRETKGLKLFVDALVSEKKDNIIDKLPPSQKQEVKQGFINLTQKQMPKAYEQIFERAVNKGEDSFRSHLKPIVRELAIENTYCPKRLFPSKINKGTLCHFISNVNLKKDNNTEYFVDKDNNPILYNKNSRTFHKTTPDLAEQNFKDYASEFLPYLKAKENSETTDASDASEKRNIPSKNKKSIPVFKSLDDEVEYWKNKKDKFQTQLSSVAGNKLTDGNPNITNLGDPERPMKLGEIYGELYDNEWTDAMEELSLPSEEDRAIQLRNILQESHDLCSKAAKNTLLDSARDMLKSEQVTPSMIEIYVQEWVEWLKTLENPNNAEKNIQQISEDLKTKYNAKPGSNLANYIDKVVVLNYKMASCIPPMKIASMPPRNSVADMNIYKHYVFSGKKVDFIVWPALFLHENGPLLYKGIFQPIREK